MRWVTYARAYAQSPPTLLNAVGCNKKRAQNVSKEPTPADPLAQREERAVLAVRWLHVPRQGVGARLDVGQVLRVAAVGSWGMALGGGWFWQMRTRSRVKTHDERHADVQ